MEQDEPSPAFTDGYDSGRDGGPRTDNPHKADSAEAEQWLKGWSEGLANRDAATPGRIIRLLSEAKEPEPTEPGEKGELAAIQGEPPTANPYSPDSAEAEEWLDGHDYATSTDIDEISPALVMTVRPDLVSQEKENPTLSLASPRPAERDG